MYVCVLCVCVFTQSLGRYAADAGVRDTKQTFTAAPEPTRSVLALVSRFDLAVPQPLCSKHRIATFTIPRQLKLQFDQTFGRSHMSQQRAARQNTVETNSRSKIKGVSASQHLRQLVSLCSLEFGVATIRNLTRFGHSRSG